MFKTFSEIFSNGFNIRYIDSDKRTPEMWIAAIISEPHIIRFIRKQTFHECFIAMFSDRNILNSIDNIFIKIQMASIFGYPKCKSIGDSNEFLMLYATNTKTPVEYWPYRSEYDDFIDMRNYLFNRENEQNLKDIMIIHIICLYPFKLIYRTTPEIQIAFLCNGGDIKTYNKYANTIMAFQFKAKQRPKKIPWSLDIYQWCEKNYTNDLFYFFRGLKYTTYTSDICITFKESVEEK